MTVARFVCEHLSKLGPSVMTRVLDTHDLLVAAVPLIENPPWTRRDAKSGASSARARARSFVAGEAQAPRFSSSRHAPPRFSGKWQKLVDQKWRDVPAEQLLDLTKLEAQLWLLLYHLVCSPDVRRKYILHSFRKGQLLRVRKFLNEVMLDQLPVLADVQRFLDELTIYDSPDATANFASGAAGSSSAFQIAGMMEQVAALHEKIHKGRDWDQVAGAIVAPGGPFGEGAATDASDESLAKLVGVYTQDGVEELLGEGASKTKELYAQPVAGLTLLAVRPAGLGAGGDGLAEHAVEYEKIPGQDAIVETSSGHFVRTKWRVAAAPATPPPPPDGADADADAEASPPPPPPRAAVPSGCKLKAEVQLGGHTPIAVAATSDKPLDLPLVNADGAARGDTPAAAKLWRQIGAVREHLAIQVQMVRDDKLRTEAGDVYVCGDCYVSTPVPRDE